MPGTMTPHSAITSGMTTTDALFILRCDEAAGSNLTDALGARTMTQTNSPGAASSLFANSISTGARTFNGTTQYAGRAAADGDQTIFQSLRFGFAAWMTKTALAATGVVIEYSEYSSPETSATNIQFAFHARSDGKLRVAWESGSGSGGGATTAGVYLSAGVRIHVGVSAEPDPDAHGKIALRFYVNGELAEIFTGLAPPDGGASSRWIIAASRDGGSAVGTPANFFDGTLDDIAMLKFTPDAAFFRLVYAQGVCDFITTPDGSETGTGVDSYAMYSQQTFTRVSVLLESTEFTDLTRIANNNTSSIGEWLSLSDINGRLDFVRSAEWEHDIDNYVGTATIRLFERFGWWNLNQLFALDNPLYAAAPAELLRTNRRIRIETAIVPRGMEREQAAKYFRLQYDGVVVSTATSKETVTVNCRDLGHPLIATQIERATRTGDDISVGSGGGQAIEDAIAVFFQDCDPRYLETMPIDDNGAGNTLLAVTMDTSVSHSWGRPNMAIVGDVMRVYQAGLWADGEHTVAAVTSTTIRYSTVFGGQPASSADLVYVPRLSYPTIGNDLIWLTGTLPVFNVDLWVPTSPGFNLYLMNVTPTQGVLDAIDSWAREIGWRVAYAWDEVREQFRLKLYDPSTSLDTVTIDDSALAEMGEVKLDANEIRNIFYTDYPNQAATDTNGDRQRYTETSRDIASVRARGRLAVRVSIRNDGLVNTSTEAATLNAILQNDLSDPKSDVDFEMAYSQIPLPNMGLLIYPTTAKTNPPILFAASTPTGTLFGSIMAVRHTISRDRARTGLSLRNLVLGSGTGSITGSIKRYTDKFVLNGLVDADGATPVSGTPAILSLVVGPAGATRMVTVTWTMPIGDRKRAFDYCEVHWSTSAGFTPSSSTFKGASYGSSCVVHVTTGSTYRFKIIFRDVMGNPTAASAEVSTGAI